ncbi:hypothetical protein P4K14_30270, partial [Bacillus cereus]|nr:hypothetical protein [Bacillus cereus]
PFFNRGHNSVHNEKLFYQALTDTRRHNCVPLLILHFLFLIQNIYQLKKPYKPFFKEEHKETESHFIKKVMK